MIRKIVNKVSQVERKKLFIILSIIFFPITIVFSPIIILLFDIIKKQRVILDSLESQNNRNSNYVVITEVLEDILSVLIQNNEKRNKE